MNSADRRESLVEGFCRLGPELGAKPEAEKAPIFQTKATRRANLAVGTVLGVGLLLGLFVSERGVVATGLESPGLNPASATLDASSSLPTAWAAGDSVSASPPSTLGAASSLPTGSSQQKAAGLPFSDTSPRPKAKPSSPVPPQKRFSHVMGKSLAEIAPYLGLSALHSVRETIGYLEALRRVGGAMLSRVKPSQASAGSDSARTEESKEGVGGKEVVSAKKTFSAKVPSGYGTGRLGFSALPSPSSGLQREWASSVLREEFNQWLTNRYEAIFSQLQAEFERWLAVRESEELPEDSSKRPRPAWVDAPPGVEETDFYQTVVAGPNATAEECQAELCTQIQKALNDYVEKYLGPVGEEPIPWDLDRLWSFLVADQWEESRVIDFGPMMGRKPMIWLYVHLRFSQAVQQEIKHQYRRVVIDHRVRKVAGGMTGLLLFLGVTYGILRIRCHRLYPPTVS